MALTHRAPSRQAYIDKLAAVSLLRGLSRKELEQVGRQVDDVIVDAGRVLVEAGRAGREFFVVLDGLAAVSRESTDLGVLVAGDCFGELALLDRGLSCRPASTGGPCSATVTAVTPLEVLVFEQRAFRGLLSSIPRLAMNLLAVLAHQLRDARAAA